MQNFITMRCGVFDPLYVKFLYSASFFRFFSFFVCGFFRQDSAETVALILNTSYGVVPRKDVPFKDPINDASHLWGQIPQKPLQKGRE